MSARLYRVAGISDATGPLRRSPQAAVAPALASNSTGSQQSSTPYALGEPCSMMPAAPNDLS